MRSFAHSPSWQDIKSYPHYRTCKRLSQRSQHGPQIVEKSQQSGVMRVFCWKIMQIKVPQARKAGAHQSCGLWVLWGPWRRWHGMAANTCHRTATELSQFSYIFEGPRLECQHFLTQFRSDIFQLLIVSARNGVFGVSGSLWDAGDG